MIKSTPKTMSSAFTPLISAMSLPFAAGNTQPTAYNNMYQMLTRSLKEEVGAQKGLVHVSTPLLLASAIPLAIMAVIGHQIDPNLADSLGVGIVRSFVQLMMLGVILNPIFKWGMTKPWLVGLYVLFMVLVATNEATSRPKYTYAYHSLLTFGTILFSLSCVGIFAFGFVIRPSPLWNPQYVIPMCGMLLGNTINGIGLSVNNMATQVMEGGRREIELCLSFGATGLESVRRLMKEAITVGVTPMVNQLNVIGLVSIPGMMTGQILGGAPVTEAARYQILIIWLIGTINFSSVFMNTYMVYKVAFETGRHMLRTDRFIEVVRSKKSRRMGFKRLMEAIRSAWVFLMCYDRDPRTRQTKPQMDGYADVEQQPLPSLEKYGTSKKCNLEIQKKQVDVLNSAVPLLQIKNLQFSVPKSHTKRKESSLKPSSSSSSLPSTFQAEQQEQQRILCEGLDFTLNKGEIGIVSGPSGSGKSTLLRVISGLGPKDEGDVTLDGMSLSSSEMTRWRSTVRYVTQYKVDIPGTPRDFIIRLSKFQAYEAENDIEEELCIEDTIAETIRSPMAFQMIQETSAYIEKWGIKIPTDESTDHPIDKEWKILSGGECQRMILAIALASRPRVLLLDEATSGLDNTSEKQVEESVLEYIKNHGASVLWVTHSDDIAERLL